MSFSMIDEEIDQWRFESIPEFQSIKIEDQYDDIESLEYIKHLPLIENFQPFESFNEEGELNSIFDESLLQLSKKTCSKDGTKENLSSKDSVAHHEQNVSIDMNKIVGDLIVTKKTDQKNEKNQRNLKIKNFNSGVLKRTDSKHLNRKNEGGRSGRPEKIKGNCLLYTKIPKLSTPAVPKRTNRWGKAEDKIMFNALISACETKGILFSDLSIEESLTNVSHYEVLLNLKREMRWVGTTKQILQRILKISEDKSNKKLSVRDQRLARKLSLKQIEDGIVDFNKIMYHFPGKNEEEVKIICNKIFLKASSTRTTE